MTPAEVSLRDYLDTRMQDMEKIIGERLDALDDKLGQLVNDAAEVRREVRELSLWRARMQGAQAAVGRLPIVVTCLGTVTAIAAAITAWAS